MVAVPSLRLHRVYSESAPVGSGGHCDNPETPRASLPDRVGSQKEPVKRREIGRPKPGPVDDEKLLLQEEIFGHESLCAAGSEQFGNRRQDVGESDE